MRRARPRSEVTVDAVAWLMGPDIRHINPLYQGDNNNPPDLFFVMHFHVDHTVRADNIDLFPGIFAVRAFVCAKAPSSSVF